MTNKELNLKLVEALPELKVRYDDEVEWQEGDETGSHVVYGDVLKPYLMENIVSKNDEVVKIIFDFIERMFDTNDESASEVIALSVLESIIMNDIDLGFVEAVLGNRSMKIWNELKDYFQIIR